MERKRGLTEKENAQFYFPGSGTLTIEPMVPKFPWISNLASKGFRRSISSQWGKNGKGRAEKSFAAEREIPYDREIDSLGSVRQAHAVGLRGKGADIAKRNGCGAIASDGWAA